eukprot:Skav203588  [mRNA]  locus=scaffold935:186864:193298:+ [translate_table: standard]
MVILCFPHPDDPDPLVRNSRYQLRLPGGSAAAHLVFPTVHEIAVEEAPEVAESVESLGELPSMTELMKLDDLGEDDAGPGEMQRMMSRSATDYARLKVERLGEVESFRGISNWATGSDRKLHGRRKVTMELQACMSETPPTTAEQADAQAKVERVLRRLLAFARSPGELATLLATELHITKLKAGDALCVVGEPADSMRLGSGTTAGKQLVPRWCPAGGSADGVFLCLEWRGGWF